MTYYQKTFPQLKIEVREEHQLWLSLNNPEQSNAITLDMVDSLTQVLKHADFDPQIRVIVLTGTGKNFCAGGDIPAMRDRTGMFAGESNELRMRYTHGIQQIPKHIEELSKPIIAMVQGAAVGAGCDLAMMCDLRTGSEFSKFAETFTKLGLVPGDGGTFFLTRVIGFAKATEMLLTGDFYEGAEAFNFGLLSQLFAEGDLETQTQNFARRIAANAPVAVQMTKKALKAAYLNDLATNLDLLAGFQGIAQRTQDHFEAVRAFETKVKPDFKGS